jgi:hypothetical protein
MASQMCTAPERIGLLRMKMTNQPRPGCHGKYKILAPCAFIHDTNVKYLQVCDKTVSRFWLYFMGRVYF